MYPINHLDLISHLYNTSAEYTFFSSAPRTFSSIDHKLDHQTSLDISNHTKYVL